MFWEMYAEGLACIPKQAVQESQTRILIWSPGLPWKIYLTIKLLANVVLLVMSKTLKHFGVNEIEESPCDSSFNHWNV